MAITKKFFNKKITVYGLGKTGISAIKVLKKLGAKVYCWDDNIKARNKAKKSNYKISKFWNDGILYDKILISPGINIYKNKKSIFFKKNSKKIITDLDLFFEINKNAKIISITGTNGKSTTCKIIEKILKDAKLKPKVVGNIGNPILNSIKFKNVIYILEVSSYQLEYSKLIKSEHAAILNISPDHLERHKNLKNYIKIKSKIFEAQTKKDYLYINGENQHSKFIKKIFKSKKIKSKLILIKKSNFGLLFKKINNDYFNSQGNKENLLFSYKIAKNLKINEKLIIKSLNNFKGLPHRQEKILSTKKVLCINDSKATSFDATLQSLSNYDKIYWIVGGLPKLGDNFNLKKIKNKIVKAYVIGKHTFYFKNRIKNKIKFLISRNIKKAVDDIYNDLKRDDGEKSTILLSPAAASFDQFKNFEERGLYFKNIILKKFKRK